MLWPSLDEFGTERDFPAWKQVGKYMGSPHYHGDRQWRCESEVVGRVLRQHAERKKAFELVLPILSVGFIRPKTSTRPAGKNRPAIKEAITTLQKSLDEDETSFVALQNVVEQWCNFFFQHECFPSTYEELQPVPLLKVGMLTSAGDDGREKGQAYRLALDLDAGVARFRFRYPDEAGVWHWRKVETIIPLPDCVKERLSEGEVMAPTLREEHSADGQRFAVLDFIIAVEKEELPAWESVERVLGADWGVHAFLTAPADKLTSSRRRWPATNRNGMPCLRSTPNEPGMGRGWHSIGGRSIDAGANRSSATEHSPIWPAMSCSCCPGCMAARCCRWSR
jgi:hypothetical protein